VNNHESQRVILELASSVIAGIIEKDERGVMLWPKIKNVALLSMIAQYQNILQNIGATSLRQKKPEDVRKPKDEERLFFAHPIQDCRRYFHILGIDIMLNERCEPVVLELNDRPSMCVTYEIEQIVKSSLVRDAFKVVTSDGSPVPLNAESGGWERVLPIADQDSQYAKDIGVILKKSCFSAGSYNQESPMKMLAKRLGYTPDNSAGKQSYRRLFGLPPLHQ
jgi:hypothetical protein